jgi:hypothetical protein
MPWNLWAVVGLLATSIATMWWLLPLGDSGLFWCGDDSGRDWRNSFETDSYNFIDWGDLSSDSDVSSD